MTYIFLFEFRKLKLFKKHVNFSLFTWLHWPLLPFLRRFEEFHFLQFSQKLFLLILKKKITNGKTGSFHVCLSFLLVSPTLPPTFCGFETSSGGNFLPIFFVIFIHFFDNYSAKSKSKGSTERTGSKVFLHKWLHAICCRCLVGSFVLKQTF